MPGLNTGHLFFITVLFILCFAFRVSRFAFRVSCYLAQL